MQLKVNISGIQFFLLVLFIILKVVGVFTWSWLWVLTPLWLPFVLFFGFLFLCVIGVYK